MEARELRIGNLLYSRDEYLCEVNEIRTYEFWCDNLDGSAITGLPYKPIPLTEEWLVKFGFEDLGADYLGLYKFKINNFCLIREQDEYCFAYESYDGEDIDLEIKYVNSLQNLYFALTGEELTIK